MARKKRDREVTWWQDQIQLGIKYREKFGRSRDWNILKSYWRNQFPKSILPVNLVYSRGAAIMAQFYPREPKVVVTAPNRPDLFMHAKLVEAIDNWLIRELNIKEVMYRCGLNAYLMADVGPWIVGYDSQFGTAPRDSDTLIQDASLTGFESSSGRRIEYDNTVSPGMPWVADVSPEDWVVPWGLDRFGRTPWYARRIVRPVEDMKADDKYDNVDGIKGNVSAHVDRSDSRRAALDKMEEKGDFYEFYEVHDLTTRRVYAVSMTSDNFHRNETDDLQIDGLSAGILQFNRDPDFFWGTSDAHYLLPQQLEINDVTTQWQKHRRTAVAKILAKRKAFNPSDIDKLTSEQVKAVVEVTGNPKEVVAELSSSIPDDFRIAREMVQQDAREMVGMSRVQAGEFQGKTHISAEETAQVGRGAEIRMDTRRDAGADMLTAMMRKINQVIFTYWTHPRVLQLMGPDKAVHWIKYRGTELRGEYLVQLDPDAAQPVTKEGRKRELLELATLVAKTGGNTTPIIQQLASEFPGIDFTQVYGESFGRGGGAATPPARPQSVDQFIGGQQGWANGSFSAVEGI